MIKVWMFTICPTTAITTQQNTEAFSGFTSHGSIRHCLLNARYIKKEDFSILGSHSNR
jgi:hypothetical protein